MPLLINLFELAIFSETGISNNEYVPGSTLIQIKTFSPQVQTEIAKFYCT